MYQKIHFRHCLSLLSGICRFYGDSLPTKDMSTANLKYLSSRQALADIAKVHDYIVDKYHMTDSNRWIAYGGSYPGALSAWLRIKYPDRIFGAVATSAPVLAEYDFKEYLEVVQNSLSVAYEGQWPSILCMGRACSHMPVDTSIVHRSAIISNCHIGNHGVIVCVGCLLIENRGLHVFIDNILPLAL